MEDRRGIHIGLGLLVLAALIMAGWVVSRVLVALYIDALWFTECGYPETFETMLHARLALGGAVLAAGVPLLLINLWIAYRRAPFTGTGAVALAQHELDPQQTDSVVRALLVLLSILVVVLLAVAVAKNWAVFLQFRYAVPFGVAEPVFGRDAGFYVFRLPAYAHALKIATILSVVALAGAAAAYYFRGAIALEESKVLHPAAFTHLTLLGAAIALCLAGRLWVARYQVLLGEGGAAFGAGYADVHAAMPAYTILSGLVIGLAGWLVINAFLRVRRGNLGSIAAFAIAWLGLGLAYPWTVQALVVRPNEWEREAEYIARTLQFTRFAYGLDQVDSRPWPGDGALTAQDLAEYPGTRDNLPLWPEAPLRDVYNQKQRIRAYYEFTDVDVDRYVIQGELRPVMLAVRELAANQLPQESRVWTNLHLQYTHGYGLCMSLANRAAPGGLPEFLVDNIPPESSGGLEVQEPRIYFGERTQLYALTHTRLEEFDYPGDLENFFNQYSGKAGIPVGSRLRRALLSWYTGNKDILLTQQFTSESKILLFRDIRERAAKLVPFLSFDEDPYPVLHQGRVLWVLDGYTRTNRFPYSEPIGNTNYLRNSIKVTIDGHDGTVRFYRVDETEPILRVFSRIFPDMFLPLGEMPKALQKHLRYPADLFRVQTLVYRRYHVEDPQVFFNGEDVWTFPRIRDGGGESWEPPRYMVMELPGSGSGPEFLLARTFTVEGKDNMIAWMAGRCDGPNYGKLVVFRLPKQRNIYGPNQAKGRFNQNPEVSAFTTLMGQMGSAVIPGMVWAIPIKDGLLYLQSLFIEDPQVRIPELKQVIAGHGDRVAMAPTIEEALAELIDEAPGVPATLAGGGAPHLEDARELYKQAQDRLKAGDWGGFGKAFEALGQVLERERTGEAE